MLQWLQPHHPRVSVHIINTFSKSQLHYIIISEAFSRAPSHHIQISVPASVASSQGISAHLQCLQQFPGHFQVLFTLCIPIIPVPLSVLSAPPSTHPPYHSSPYNGSLLAFAALCAAFLSCRPLPPLIHLIRAPHFTVDAQDQEFSLNVSQVQRSLFNVLMYFTVVVYQDVNLLTEVDFCSCHFSLFQPCQFFLVVQSSPCLYSPRQSQPFIRQSPPHDRQPTVCGLTLPLPNSILCWPSRLSAHAPPHCRPPLPHLPQPYLPV